MQPNATTAVRLIARNDTVDVINRNGGPDRISRFPPPPPPPAPMSYADLKRTLAQDGQVTVGPRTISDPLTLAMTVAVHPDAKPETRMRAQADIREQRRLVLAKLDAVSLP